MAPTSRRIIPTRFRPAHDRVRRWAFIALIAGGITFLPATLARADGDPASDYLINKQVFLSAQAGPPSASQRALINTVAAANRVGFPIRVAVIGSQYDLGSIVQLWQKPRIYARFLGIELQGAYRQRLLVAMPNGFGFNWPGHSVRAAYGQLARMPLASGESPLAGAARAAVVHLAAADGVKLPAGSSSTGSAGASKAYPWQAVVGGLLALFLVIAAVVLVRTWPRWRPRRRRPRATSAPATRRLVMPAAALVCGCAVAVPAILLMRRGASAASVSPASVATAPPIRWPAGRRPAPNFVLHDQNGGLVSPAAFRGRPLIVTFIDPLCRNLCPLEAHVLNQTVRELPPAQRPQILAVSVDPSADTRANLIEDYHKWDLVPQWHWGIGPPAQLAAIWKRYAIGVTVIKKTIAGTTVRYIEHTEAAYVLDTTGHERALFVWPFYPPDVKRLLGQIA